jgi:hypothetical protein
MRQLPSILAVLVFVPWIMAADPRVASPMDPLAEDHARTLQVIREQRQQLLQTLGANHPQVMALNREIGFREALIPLKAKLEEKVAEVKLVEAEIQSLLKKHAEAVTPSPSGASSAIDQKLDAIMRQLEQMDRRLADLEKAKTRQK